MVSSVDSNRINNLKTLLAWTSVPIGIILTFNQKSTQTAPPCQQTATQTNIRTSSLWLLLTSPRTHLSFSRLCILLPLLSFVYYRCQDNSLTALFHQLVDNTRHGQLQFANINKDKDIKLIAGGINHFKGLQSTLTVISPLDLINYYRTYHHSAQPGTRDFVYFYHQHLQLL